LNFHVGPETDDLLACSNTPVAERTYQQTSNAISATVRLDIFGSAPALAIHPAMASSHPRVASEEFRPVPQTAKQRETEARLHAIAGAMAPKLGFSRRHSFRCAAGMRPLGRDYLRSSSRSPRRAPTNHRRG